MGSASAMESNEAAPDTAACEEPAIEENAEASIARLLEHLPAAGPPAHASPSGVSVARVTAVKGRTATVATRGSVAPFSASIDEGVDAALIEQARVRGDRVLLEVDPVVGYVVVGVVQTRLPETLELRADRVVVEAGRELILRSGRGALRIREDGDVELVGSRVSMLSRGLFRVVGRILRLN